MLNERILIDPCGQKPTLMCICKYLNTLALLVEKNIIVIS